MSGSGFGQFVDVDVRDDGRSWRRERRGRIGGEIGVSIDGGVGFGDLSAFPLFERRESSRLWSGERWWEIVR